MGVILLKTFKVIYIVAIAILLFGLTVPPQDFVHAEHNNSRTNLLKNGGFEKTEKNNAWVDNRGPASWIQWKPVGNPQLFVDDQVSQSGKQSAKIYASNEGRTAISQDVQVTPGKQYKLSAWIKTKNVTSKHGARLRMSFHGSKKEHFYTNKVSGTSGWTHVEKIARVPEGDNTVRILNFLEKGEGTAWFDNVTFEPTDGTEKTSVFSFESGVPSAFSIDDRSSLTTTDSHYKDGKHSLEWIYQGNSQLTISNPIGFNNIKKDAFGVWIYNEKPVDDQLQFQFEHNGKSDASFSFNLNFKGWRIALVPFNDMKGDPSEDMNDLVITAPQSVSQGSLYIDQMILSSPVPPGDPTRDAQVPFVNKEADHSPSSNWQALYLFDSLLPKKYNTKVTDKDRDALHSITKKYQKYAMDNSAPKAAPISKKVTKKYMKEIRNEYQSYGISRENGSITGRPVNLDKIQELYPKEVRSDLEKLVNAVDLRDYTDFMNKVAIAYHSTENSTYKNELKTMFLNVTEHMYDQGWAWGSSLGIIHHYGYQIRRYFPAMFLMKNELKEAGLLDRIQKAMSWYSGLGRIYRELDEDSRHANADTLNTILRGMLSSILIKDDTEKQVVLLNRFEKWLSHGLLPAPGLMDFLKPDGSAFHHKGSYPAYARDALEGMSPVVYMLSDTPFHISEQAHKILKKAVLSSRLYSNKYDWLVGLGARHPTDRLHLQSYPFKYMALAGTPNGKKNIDPELAEAYLRLVKPDEVDETTKRLRSKGFDAESAPNGDWTMNHSVLELHRRDNWLVGVTGHNRYRWSNEIYAHSNLYGRYTTYGQIQILSKGNPVNYSDSGYTPNKGWDWNRWPGTTTKHLPLDQLKAKSTTEMLLTDETYAGGLNIQGKNGMFAMKLHENPKYDESFRARKSVFMFGDRVIALGSDIENTDTKHNTETTLFQNHMEDNNNPIRIDGQKITDFPYKDTLDVDEPIWMLDNKDNGYYIPADQTIGVQRKIQHSRDHKDKRDTQGKFATSWIKHGMAPDNGSYEYAILVDTNPGQMKAFTNKMKNSNSAPYTVLQKNAKAHIVKDKKTKTTGYALMEANDALNKGRIISVDTPSMVMTKEKGNNLILSEVDPDWRLYRGKDEDQYDDDGNFVGGVGPYDRPWKDNESKMHQLHLTIKGEWELEEKGDNYRIISRKDNKTVLEFDNKNAMPIEIKLSPVNGVKNAAEMKEIVKQFKNDDAFTDEQVARDLKLHLTAVHHYEMEKADNKVVKHMKNFKLLLDHEKNNKSISDEAYNTLQKNADTLIKKWQQ